MDTTTVWTTKGWVECLDIAYSDYSDYSGGTVQRSNLEVILRDAEEQEIPVCEGHHYGNLAFMHRNHCGADGEQYFEPRSIPDGDAVVIRYYGSHGTSGVLVKLGTEYGERIANAIANYPLLDDEHHSNLEEEACAEVWNNADLNDRIHYLKRHMDYARLRGSERREFRNLSRLPYGQLYDHAPELFDNGYLRDRLLSC